jgi:hypothetical protein
MAAPLVQPVILVQVTTLAWPRQFKPAILVIMFAVQVTLVKIMSACRLIASRVFTVIPLTANRHIVTPTLNNA